MPYNVTPDLEPMLQGGQPNAMPEFDQGAALQQLIQKLLEQSQQSQQQVQQPQQLPNGVAPFHGAQPLQDQQQPLAQQLVQHMMTQGLNNQLPNGQTGLNFQQQGSGAQGYAGPLRSSDVPAQDVVPTMKPDQARAEDQMQSLRATNVPGFTNAGQAMDIATSLKGYPKEVVDAVLKALGINVQPPIEQQMQLAQYKAQLAASGKQGQPLGANATKYINKTTGEFATPDQSMADVTKGSQYMALDPNKERLWTGINNLKNHVDLTQQYLGTLPENSPAGRSWNSFKMFLRQQKNDPDAVTLAGQLESLTPIALSQSLSTGAMRGGATLAKMLKEAALTGGEDRATATEKLNNLRRLAYRMASENGLPTEPLKDMNIPLKGIEQAGPTPQPSSQPADANMRAQASQLIVKAKQQLGTNATPDQIKELARKMMQRQGNQ